jgi:hypothetical protein
MFWLFILIAVSAVIYILAGRVTVDNKPMIFAETKELARIAFFLSLAVALVVTYLK